MAATGALVHTATFAGIFALLALGLNIKFGFSGLLDFGHVAFFLVGAYVAALLVLPPAETQDLQSYVLGLGVPWIVAIVAACLAAGFLGLVVALPAIRLREDYLAIALLGISVILVRIVQSESWLANGPDSLRGYHQPFRDVFPLPGATIPEAVALGATVLVVFAFLSYFAAGTEAIASRDGVRGAVVHALLVVTTLGVGYWAARRTRSRLDERAGGGGPLRLRDYSIVLGTAGAVGLVATVASLVGLGELAILVLLGVASLGTWVVTAILLREHYRGYGLGGGVLGLGIAAFAYLTLFPAVLFGSAASEAVVTIAIAATFVAIAALCVGVYVLYDRWERLPVGGDFLGIVGIATAWLLGIRYFVVSLRGSRSLGDVLGTTIQNLLWLVDIDFVGGGLGFDYNRFFLIVVVATVGAVFLLLEATVRSPFGRVLKSIREDEDVALALGKNTFAFKVQTMVLGSAIAGLAGAYWAINLQSLNFQTFHPIVTFFIFLIVILGGSANNRGVVLGAALYWIFVRATVELAAQFPAGISARISILRNAIIGLLLMVILYYRPEGLWGEERIVVEVDGE